MLKAKKPEMKEKRLKMFVYGPAGVGKTMGAIQFPNSYIIDTERGTDFYANTIARANSVVLQTLNPDDVKEELRALLTEKHAYKTLIIDPITQIYNATQEKWTRIFEKYAKSDKDGEVQDFGMRYWGKVKGDFKSIQRLMLALDMNVIVTSHQKDVYGTGFNKLGVTFDSMKGDDYFFDLVFQVERKNGALIAKTIKERAELGKNRFPADFEWSYDNFCKFYGKEIIEKTTTPVEMATNEQIEAIKKLIEVVKIDDETINKWMVKADVSDWQEMTGEQISKCIDFVQKKLDSLKNSEPQKKEKVKK
jgi:GTPase SAR1 family protein